MSDISFEEWLKRIKPKPIGLSDSHWLFITSYMKIAYEAGWNACRDKWGGLEYEDKFNFD